MGSETQNARTRRYRNGSLWRDPDVLHVLAVGTVATGLSLGSLYLWFLLRTWRTARSAPVTIDGATSAIVFGKRLQQGRLDRDYRWRLRQALRLLRDDPQLHVIVSGGHSGSPSEPSEAQAGCDWLLRRLPSAAGRIHIEAGSADTIDNLRRARTLLPPGPVALLSNRYHLARCQLLARHLGLDARLCAAEPALRSTRATIGRIVLEAGYHTVFVVGRAWARLIGSQRMLSRIS